MRTNPSKRIISDEVGRCEKCGKFQRWADMGHMKPDGSVVLCQTCIKKSIDPTDFDDLTPEVRAEDSEEGKVITYPRAAFDVEATGDIAAMWPWQRIQLVRSPTEKEWRGAQPMRGVIGDFGIVLPDPTNEENVVIRDGLIRVLHNDFVVRWPASCVEVFRRHPGRRIQRCGGYVRLLHPNQRTGLVVGGCSSAASQYTISRENGASCEYWFLGDCEPCDAPSPPPHHGIIKIGDSVRYTALPGQGHERGAVGRVVDLPPSPGSGYWVEVAGTVCCWFSHHFEPCDPTGAK